MFGEARAPAVTQDSLVTPSATRVAGFQTATSGLRRVIWKHAPTVGFRGDIRARSCAACDPDLSKAHTLNQVA
jgi:hypothetical protein